MSSRKENATKPDGSSRGAKSKRNAAAVDDPIGAQRFLFVSAKRRKPKSTPWVLLGSFVSFFSVGVKR